MTSLAIIQLLKNDAAIGAIVGDKISLSYIPQGEAAPSIVLNVEDDKRGSTKDDIGTSDMDIDITSVADSAAVCLQLDSKVYQLLQHYKQTAPVALSSGEIISINHSYQVATRSEFNQEIKYHTTISTYRILSTIITS